MRDLRDEIIAHIFDCPRCGGQHKHVTFRRLKSAWFYDPVTHHGACPANGDPIVAEARIVTDGRGTLLRENQHADYFAIAGWTGTQWPHGGVFTPWISREPR